MVRTDMGYLLWRQVTSNQRLTSEYRARWLRRESRETGDKEQRRMANLSYCKWLSRLVGGDVLLMCSPYERNAELTQISLSIFFL